MTDDNASAAAATDSQDADPPRRAIAATPDPAADAQDDEASIMGGIEQPAKVMRIGSMVKQLLEEVRAAPLDEKSRERLRTIHTSSVKELEAALSGELREELERLTSPFGDDVPSEAELRVVQAQLVGWLEGLFHGMQLAAQQIAVQQQLQEMRRRALPGGAGGPGGPGGGPIVVGPGGQVLNPNGPSEHGTGQYL